MTTYDATTGLPIAQDRSWQTPDIRGRLSAARENERETEKIPDLPASLFPDTKEELNRLRVEAKKTNRIDRDRIDEDIWNLEDFVENIITERLDKIVGLARSEAICRSTMDRTGMTDDEKIMMNKMVDAIRVYLDETYQKAGVTG